MNSDKQELLEQHYEPTDEPGWYRCVECGAKVYATERRAEDLAAHELREHPER